MKKILFKSNPQNLINIASIEDLINTGIKFKRIENPEVKKWLNSTFRKHIINVIPSSKVTTLSKDVNHPEWLIKAFKDGSLYQGVISDKLIEEYYHVLDFILDKKPKLGSALEVLAKVQAWDKSTSKKKEEFEKRIRKSGKSVKLDEMGQMETILEFDDGFSIVSLLDEKSKDWEGTVMGHCVGGNNYDEEIIYSLRDARYMPHATMQIQDNKIVQLQGKENKEVIEKYHEYIINFLNETRMDIEDFELNKIGMMRIIGEIKK